MVGSASVTRRQFLVLIVPLMAVLLGFLVLLLVERENGVGDTPWDPDLATYVRTSMADEFVWGVPKGRKGWEAYFNALNAWVTTFDPYGAVIAPWDVEASQEQSSGQYGGIGIRIRPPSDLELGKPLERVEVVGVKPGGPADRAGVHIGDWIIGVDGKRVSDICPTGDDTALKNAVRGEKGSKVLLRLRAPDGVERETAPVRAKIDTGSVFGVRLVDPDRGIGYIRIAAFQAGTSRDFRAACAKLHKEGLEALILDLRHDGGGLLDQAVEVADSLLAEGVIVRQRGRSGRFSEVREATASTALSRPALGGAHRRRLGQRERDPGRRAAGPLPGGARRRAQLREVPGADDRKGVDADRRRALQAHDFGLRDPFGPPVRSHLQGGGLPGGHRAPALCPHQPEGARRLAQRVQPRGHRGLEPQTGTGSQAVRGSPAPGRDRALARGAAHAADRCGSRP